MYGEMIQPEYVNDSASLHDLTSDFVSLRLSCRLYNGPDCEEKLQHITEEIEEIINKDPKTLKEAFDSYDPDCQDAANDLHTVVFKENKSMNCDCYLCKVTEKKSYWVGDEMTNSFCIVTCSEQVPFLNEKGEEKIVKNGDVIQLIPTEKYIFDGRKIVIKDTDRFYIYTPKEFIKTFSKQSDNNFRESAFIYMFIYFSMFEDLFSIEDNVNDSALLHNVTTDSISLRLSL